MKVKVRKGPSFQTEGGKTHKEGEILEVGKGISKEEYESDRDRFEQEGHEQHKGKKDAAFDKAFDDKPWKRK